MKIIELRAENIKRLRAVEITPSGDMVVIGGNNAQGKSSVLDAIWLALGGGKASKETPLPIRDGEEKASVRLDLGDLVVTRSWTRKGTSLKVENAEGAQYKSPQSMLDALVGQLSFDPLAFTRLSPKEQREALLDLVDLDVDLDALDAEAKQVYQQRTDVGRQGKAIGDIPAIDDDLPKNEESMSEWVQRLGEAQETENYLATTSVQLDNAEVDIRNAEAEIARLESLIETRTKEAKHLQQVLADTERPDLRMIQLKIGSVEDTNAKIRANNAAKARLREKVELRERYSALTDRLTELDEQKASALASASFPVAGLSFNESGVLYNGVPLSQASSAEQIRVSLAMGMALNPRLKVLMIKDGSLLDANSMAAIREQIADGDYQLWLERVGDADKGAVIIEDGQVA